MAHSFQVIPPRPAPVNTEGLIPWGRANLFANALSTLTTLALLAFFAWFLPTAVNWLVLKAVWVPNFDTCQAARGSGACWGVVAEKYRIIIFGRYPLDQQWRPELAMLALLGLLVASCVRPFWETLAGAAVAGGAGADLRPDGRRRDGPAAPCPPTAGAACP